MTRRKTFCPYCSRVVPAGQRCSCRPKSKRNPTQGDTIRSIREPWREEYDRAEFRRNRQTVIENQQGRCKDCNKVCAKKVNGRWITKGYGGQVDHEKPLCEGGTNDVSNLALRCIPCHSRADAARRKKRRS